MTVSPDRDDNVGECSLRDEQVFSFTLVLDNHIFATFLKTMEVAEMLKITMSEKYINYYV